MIWGNVEFLVTPDVLRTQARETQRRIEAMIRRFDELDAVFKRTKSYWAGDTAALYNASYAREREEIRQALQAMKRFPPELLEIAGNYSKTDEAVASSAAMLKIDALH